MQRGVATADVLEGIGQGLQPREHLGVAYLPGDVVGRLGLLVRLGLALLGAANFFDFRRVAGTLSLDSLEEILDEAADNQIFLAHLAAAGGLGFLAYWLLTRGFILEFKRKVIAEQLGDALARELGVKS